MPFYLNFAYKLLLLNINYSFKFDLFITLQWSKYFLIPKIYLNALKFCIMTNILTKLTTLHKLFIFYTFVVPTEYSYTCIWHLTIFCTVWKKEQLQKPNLLMAAINLETIKNTKSFRFVVLQILGTLEQYRPCALTQFWLNYRETRRVRNPLVVIQFGGLSNSAETNNRWKKDFLP